MRRRTKGKREKRVEDKKDDEEDPEGLKRDGVEKEAGVKRRRRRRGKPQVSSCQPPAGSQFQGSLATPRIKKEKQSAAAAS